MGVDVGAPDYQTWLERMTADERIWYEKCCNNIPASAPTPYQQKAKTNEDRPPVGTKRDIPIWRR